MQSGRVDQLAQGVILQKRVRRCREGRGWSATGSLHKGSRDQSRPGDPRATQPSQLYFPILPVS